MLSGQLEVSVGDETYRLEPGDAMYYDSRLEHSLRSVEGTSVRLLACIAQARRPRVQAPLGRSHD